MYRPEDPIAFKQLINKSLAGGPYLEHLSQEQILLRNETIVQLLGLNPANDRGYRLAFVIENNTALPVDISILANDDADETGYQTVEDGIPTADTSSLGTLAASDKITITADVFIHGTRLSVIAHNSESGTSVCITKDLSADLTKLNIVSSITDGFKAGSVFRAWRHGDTQVASSRFSELLDGPQVYEGFAGKSVRVRFDEQGIEYGGNAIDFKGAWAAGAYLAYDAVEHNGSAYVALVDTSGEPGVSADWHLFTSKGDQGVKGDTGADSTVPGPQGDDGADGSVIYSGSGDPQPHLPDSGVAPPGFNNNPGETEVYDSKTWTCLTRSAPTGGALPDQIVFIGNDTVSIEGSWGTILTTWETSDTLGVDGDYYLDTDNSDFYKNTAGVWAVILTLSGASTWAQLDKTSSSVGDIADVDITTVAPVDGQALVWQTDKFVPGNVAAEGTGGGSFVEEALVYEEVLSADRQTITIPVDSDIDGGYSVELLVPVSIDSGVISLYINGDETDANYTAAYVEGNTAVINTASNNAYAYPLFGFTTAGYSAISHGDISIAAGYVVWTVNAGRKIGTSDLIAGDYHGYYDTQVAKITSLTFKGVSATHFKAGTVIRIKRKKPLTVAANINEYDTSNLVKEIVVTGDSDFPVVFDGLDSDIDEGYLLEYAFITTTAGSLGINVNDITSGYDSTYRIISSSGNTISGGDGGDRCDLGGAGGGGATITGKSEVSCFNGAFRCITHQIQGVPGAGNFNDITRAAEVTGVPKITKLAVVDIDGATISAGAVFRLYKKKKNAKLAITTRYLSNLVEEGVLAGGETEVVMSGLDIITDGGYRIEIEAFNTDASGSLRLLYNEDTVNTDYIFGYDVTRAYAASSPTHDFNGGQGNDIGSLDVNQSIKISVEVVLINGEAFAVSETVKGYAPNGGGLGNVVYTVRKLTSIANISKMTVLMSAGSFAAGSKYRLYKTNGAAQIARDLPFNRLAGSNSDLAGQTGKIPAVNAAEDGMEFIDPPTGGGGTEGAMVFQDYWNAGGQDPHLGSITIGINFDGSVYNEKSGGVTLNNIGVGIETSLKLFGTGSGKFIADDYIHMDGWYARLFSGDFTVETWMYVPSLPGGGVNNDMTVYGRLATNYPFFYIDNGNGTARLWNGSQGAGTSQSIPLGQWCHVAWTREAGTLRIFIDGVKGYEGSYTTDFSGTSTYYIGAAPGNSRSFVGNMDSMRITRGVSRYNEDFDVPTVAFNYQTAFNPPAAAIENKGHYYIVSGAGDYNLSGIAEWAVGDWAVSNGVTWDKLDNTPPINLEATVHEQVTTTKDTWTADYEPGSVDVWVGGLKLAPEDFTAADGETIVLANAITGTVEQPVPIEIKALSNPITKANAVTDASLKKAFIL